MRPSRPDNSSSKVPKTKSVPGNEKKKELSKKPVFFTKLQKANDYEESEHKTFRTMDELFIIKDFRNFQDREPIKEAALSRREFFEQPN